MIETVNEIINTDDTEIEVMLGDANTYQAAPAPDNFAQGGDMLKSLNGLNPNMKRKITTDMRKAYNGDGASSKKKDYDSITGYDTFSVVSPPYNLEYLAGLYEINSPHYAAVKAKVSNIVGLGYDFVESPKTKAKLDEMDSNDVAMKFRKKLTRAKNDLNDIIDSFNTEDTFLETLTKVWTDYEVTGNGYIEVGRKTDGTIGYVGHIPATTVRVRRARDGFVQIISNQATFFRNFGELTKDPVGTDTRPNEIIHLKKYSPSSSYYGIPDVIAARQAIAGMEFSARFNLDYFENKAVPRHLIILKGAKLGTTAQRSLIEFFETGLRGQNHRSVLIPLPGDSPNEKVSIEIKPIEAGVQESSFDKYDTANIAKVLMAHRVPIGKVSSAQGQSLANARDADKTFKEQVCQPEQKILEPKLNKIIKELNDIFVLKLNEMTLTDEDTQSKIDERYLKVGAILRNEVRARKGLPGIEKGDEIIDLNKDPQAKSDATANRARDAARSAGATDSAGNGRNPKGDGRTVQ